MASRTTPAARKPRRKRKDIVRFAAHSCVHAPLHDEDAIAWYLGQLEEHQPDYVISLGDDLEADGASRWPSEKVHTLIDEYAADDDIKRRIIEVTPNATHIRLMGNHCANILEQGRINPKLRELCDWRIPQFSRSGVQVNKNALKWRVAGDYRMCKRRGVYRLGQVTFGHGWLTTAKADAQHSVMLGCPMGLFIGGHLHAPSAVQQAMMTPKIPLPYWYANAGCLRMLDTEYMKRKNAFNWGQACVLGEADLRCGPAKSLRMTRQWAAETRIKEMYADWVDRRVG